jgi:Uma2 family endonuclease
MLLGEGSIDTGSGQGAAMTATGIRMTADELLGFPDNGMRRELIDGELHEMPAAGGEHGFVGASILGDFLVFLRQHPEIGGGLFTAETGFRLTRNPDTVRAPDVAYVGPKRLALAKVRGFPELAPDLVVEVVSPNDTAAEVHHKVDEWLNAGVVVVCVLYPATRSAMVYRQGGAISLLHADDSLDAEPVIPGFSCRVGDLF